MTTKTLTRDEYNRMVSHAYAGTAGELMVDTVAAFRAGDPDWDGKHWAMWAGETGGATLGPVNVR